MLFEMSGFILADFLDQHATPRGSHTGVRLKIIREKGDAVLIENFEQKPVGKFDRGQTPANSFHEDRVTNVAENSSVGRAHSCDDIGDQPVIRQPGMNWRDHGFVGFRRLFAPVTGPKILSDHLGRCRDRCN